METVFSVKKLAKSQQSIRQIADFIKANEYLLPDPYSQKVDITEYAAKLNTLGECWCIESDGKMAGFVGGYINDLVKKRAFLQLILISAEYQDKHCGQSLINVFTAFAREHGFNDVQLTVDLCNEKALNFYNKLGFVKPQENHPNKNKQYMILKLEKQADIKEIQNRLSKMGYIIANIFEKHNIPHMITFGTLLGAVRHGGFIPWDDDFDFFLFDDTYDFAIEILRKELPDNMFVEDAKSEPLFFHGWAHVKDLNSEVFCEQFPQDNLYSHHGLSVDLYRCKKMNMSELCIYRKEQSKAYLERKLAHKLITRDEFDKKMALFSAKIEAEEKENANSDNPILAMAVPERYMECKDVFPLKKYRFDNYSFFGPNNADGILTHFYGDYMSLPKEENRIPHYSKVVFKD